MSLFDEPTAEQRTAEILRNNAVGAFAQLRAAFENGQLFVWKNPYGLTPQQALDSLGKDAAEMVVLSKALATFLNTYAPEAKQVASKMPESIEVTANEDGTVTAKQR